MKYLLLVSIVVNLILACKILAMRISLRSLKEGFAERCSQATDTNTLLRVSSRDRTVRELATTLNEQLSDLRAAYHRYVQGDNEIKTAITNIAHDLRTPLTAILGYLELCEDLDLTPEVEKNLAIIKDRALHMKKLTQELFEYSIISSGEIKEEKQDVSVNQVLEDCIMNFYPALSERGIEPVIEITEHAISRSLYPSYAERIITNLISNAAKYSDGDLMITLSDQGKLTVANSAKELSTVDVNKLFDRFFTVESARNHSTGLGLSIVKLFAERMDCPLSAYYKDGKLFIEIDF